MPSAVSASDPHGASPDDPSVADRGEGCAATMPLVVWLVTDSTLPSGMSGHMLDLARAIGGRASVSIVAPDVPGTRRLLDGALRPEGS